MQVLLTTGTLAGTQPIYLPYDKAPVPFGDPLAATVTSANPGVFTVPGYLPSVNDAVSFTIQGPTGFLTTLAGLSTVGQPSTTYYVVSPSADTFSLSTAKGGTGVSIVSTMAQNGGTVIVHLLSNQVDGTTIPFKPGNTVLAMNGGSAATLTTVGTSAVTLFGASDLTTVYGNPIGPGTWNVIATVGFGTPQLVQLKYDWIVASGSTSSLVLLQN
jgi:hypothetical protein